MVEFSTHSWLEPSASTENVSVVTIPTSATATWIEPEMVVLIPAEGDIEVWFASDDDIG